MIKFGASIKKYRMKANLTQERLSSMVGVQSTFLSALENDKKEPSITLIKKISSALKVPVELVLLESLFHVKASGQDKEIISTLKKLAGHYRDAVAVK
jgi:transcriptional regulator with XRE-family HTH domain